MTKIDLTRDGVCLVGAGLISYGTWLVDDAVGFIVGGFLLIAGAILSALQA